MRTLKGRCHCGAVEVRLTTPGSSADLPLRRCLCTHCRPRRLRYTSDPKGSVSIVTTPPGHLDAYSFGTKTARFLRCATCGMLVGAVCETDGLRAVINADLYLAFQDRPHRDMRFDDEGVAARLERRSRTWTPVAPESTLGE